MSGPSKGMRASTARRRTAGLSPMAARTAARPTADAPGPVRHSGRLNRTARLIRPPRWLRWRPPRTRGTARRCGPWIRPRERRSRPRPPPFRARPAQSRRPQRPRRGDHAGGRSGPAPPRLPTGRPVRPFGPGPAHPDRRRSFRCRLRSALRGGPARPGRWREPTDRSPPDRPGPGSPSPRPGLCRDRPRRPGGGVRSRPGQSAPTCWSFTAPRLGVRRVVERVGDHPRHRP